MTSLPPGQCCMTGITHEGIPKGSIENIREVPTYLAQPSQHNGHAIVICTDVFGHIFPNIQLIADQFATHGYLVAVPDLFQGDAVSPDAFFGGTVDLPTWLESHGTENVDPVLDNIIDYLRNVLHIKMLAGIGYCFGAKYVVRNLHANRLDAGYVAHPSFVTSEELSAITNPLSIAAAEVDSIFTTEKRAESEKILAGLQVPYQINLYGAVSHGFAVKGDLSDKRVKFATDCAFEQATTWLKYWV